jgi:hypothetical protein
VQEQQKQTSSLDPSIANDTMEATVYVALCRLFAFVSFEQLNKVLYGFWANVIIQLYKRKSKRAFVTTTV